MSKARTIATITALLLLASAMSFAGDINTWQYTLTTANSSSGMGTANFGTVTVSLNPNGSASVFIALNTAPPGHDYSFIFPDGNDVSINGMGCASSAKCTAGFTSVISGLKGGNQAGNPTTVDIPMTFNYGSGTVSDFGSFSLILAHITVDSKLSTASNKPMYYLSFTITKQGGSFTAEDLQRLVFVLHILDLTTGKTGFVTTGPPTPVPVPEPASMVLIGTGLAALLSKRWRAVRKGAASS